MVKYKNHTELMCHVFIWVNSTFFRSSVTSDYFHHFDTLIQTIRSLYIVFEIIWELCKKRLNHGRVKNLPFMLSRLECLG